MENLPRKHVWTQSNIVKVLILPIKIEKLNLKVFWDINAELFQYKKTVHFVCKKRVKIVC